MQNILERSAGMGVEGEPTKSCGSKKSNEGEAHVDLAFYCCFRGCHLSECGSNHHAANGGGGLSRLAKKKRRSGKRSGGGPGAARVFFIKSPRAVRGGGGGTTEGTPP